MSMAGTLAAGVLGGTTTMVTRRVLRRALHAKDGAPRLPRRVRHQHGLAAMLLWAAAAGAMLALADLLMEQRTGTMQHEG